MIRYSLPILLIVGTVFVFWISYMSETFRPRPVISLLIIFFALVLGIFNFFDAQKKNKSKAVGVMNLIFAAIAILLILFAVGVFFTAVNSGV